MKRLFLIVLFFPVAALAQSDVIYTPTSGTFSLKAQTAASIPDTMDTASVQIVRGDGLPLACADVGPDQVATIPVTVLLSTLPLSVWAKGWTGPGCTGEETALSPNQGTLRLAVPDPPWLVQ